MQSNTDKTQRDRRVFVIEFIYFDDSAAMFCSSPDLFIFASCTAERMLQEVTSATSVGSLS